jgi:hypothetical protein
MEPEDSAPCLQALTAESYPEPDKSSPNPHTIFFKVYFNVIYYQVPKMVCAIQVFRLKCCMRFSCLPFMPHLIALI